MTQPQRKAKEKAKAGASAKAKTEKNTQQNSARPANEEYLMALLHTIKQPLDFESAAKELGINKVTCQTRYSRLKKIYYPDEVKVVARKKRDVTATKEGASPEPDIGDSPESPEKKGDEMEDTSD